MKIKYIRIIALIIFSFSLIEILHSQDYKILESDMSHLVLEFDFDNKFEVNDILIEGIKFTSISKAQSLMQNPGDPQLPIRIYEIGIPQNAIPVVSILAIDRQIFKDKFVISAPDSANQPIKQLNYNQTIYGVNADFPTEIGFINSSSRFRFINTSSLSISPFQFNPVSRTLTFNKRIKIRIDYNLDTNFNEILIPVTDRLTEELIKTNLINSNVALNFQAKTESVKNNLQNNYWYDPNKDYCKIYLNKKGVFRITYDMLINAGIPDAEIGNMHFELFNNGQSIPIDIVDSNNDSVFGQNDYFQFVGTPAIPQDQFTRVNIYNNTNIYWFSYQADSVNHYKFRDGDKRTAITLVYNTIETLRFEKDSIYSHLGQASNDRRDYWYWNKAEFRGGISSNFFRYVVLDSIWDNIFIQKPQAKIKVGLHGLTSQNCQNGFTHSAQVLFNSYPIGSLQWDGQESATFEKDFHLSFTHVGGDTVYLNWENPQEIIVKSTGEVCDSIADDVFLVNYLEFQYWRWNKTNKNHYYFSSPPNDLGENIYWMYNWLRDNMKVYIPSRGELIPNPWITNDTSKSVRFVDTLSTQTEYFCVADDYFELPDSLIFLNSNSDLRNVNNGADYIIITHPNFLSAAQQLANFRSNHLRGYDTPRIKVVNILDIYNEFSYGLLNPNSLNAFVKFAFENWQQPAPAYVVLLGDLSSDYRKVNPSSLENFIPSPAYHSSIYGQAASDNNIVTVAGNDFLPDLAIGRLSCETIDEANFLVDRIINYPADTNKEWKQNILLLSSGLTQVDENLMKFNQRNMKLANSYIEPVGINTSKVFRYPDSTLLQYKGEGPEIRQEIDKGAVIVNYYGHGGGFQWDLVFTDDDIYALNNGNKLPVVISVTCYTAHFDNQDIFGEIFNSVSNKGSIAFFGSSGVTFWPTTAFFNDSLFSQIFRNKRHILGEAILKAKSTGPWGSMIPLLTLLGDPALEMAIPYTPDFVIEPSSITINPLNPIINDTVEVKLVIKNLGRKFNSDSVRVELYENVISDTTIIGIKKLASFGETDSTYFSWTPVNDGIAKMIAVINSDHKIDESDYFDNTATQNFSVFSVDKPKILKPQNNYSTTSSFVDFVIADIGYHVEQNFLYQIIIDSSRSLNSAFKIISPIIGPNRGLVKWSTPSLPVGEYFYYIYIYSISDTNKSNLRTFSISPSTSNGYLAQSKQLLDYTSSNIIYSDSLKSLVLNVLPLPPKPSAEKLLDSIMVVLPEDSTEITTCTTDGTYLYFGHLSYYTGGEKSKIYKVGTGLNNTIKGMLYGSIGNLELNIKNQIFYHNDGYIYAATGDDSTLLQINIQNGDTNRITIPNKLLPSEDGLLKNGGYYLTSDGRYIYNLSAGYGTLRNKYILRVLDPTQNWNEIQDDIIFAGSSASGFSGFFVTQNYIQTYETLVNGYTRRYRLSDGYFEEEYLPFIGNKKVYSWTYDWNNNFLYGGLFLPNNFNYDFGFYKFVGIYKEAAGTLISNEIGPARSWIDLKYNIDALGSQGTFKNQVLGKNKLTENWDTLKSNIQSNTDISDISNELYQFLKIKFDFVDSTLGISEPLKFKSLQVGYSAFPEIHTYPDEIFFNSDSLLQGFPIEMNYTIENIGFSQVENLKLDFYNNLSDTAFYSTLINLPADSSLTTIKSILTENLLFSAPVSPINIRVVINSPIQEYYTFNNESDGSFYVVRDSIKPNFTITFDDKELIDGDVISSEPRVVMTIEDNSPLPITQNHFSLQHNNVPLNFYDVNDSLKFDYTPYPNSKAVVTWTPKLEDGTHTLTVFVKDSSGNPFNSSQMVYRFNVFNNPDLLQVYNYPNPFKDKTDFTFEVRGVIPPEELKIKIFTVAGRLIKEIVLPGSSLQIGFNRIPWDGLDQDGDEIANGVYFYKIISKHGDEVKTVTQKLAKLK